LVLLLLLLLLPLRGPIEPFQWMHVHLLPYFFTYGKTLGGLGEGITPDKKKKKERGKKACPLG
jgi:hypothetical protein